MKGALAVTLFFSFVAHLAHAADGSVALSISGDFPGNAPASAGPLGFIANFYTFALTVSGILALAIIIYAAIRYSFAQGNASTQGDARDQITQAFLGLLLLFGAGILLRMVNPDLTIVSLPSLDALKKAALPATYTGPALVENEANIRKMLSGLGGITVNADPPKTQLAGLRTETVNGVIQIKNACRCSLIITGGSEPHTAGDYSHGNGYKIDLDPNDALNAYIKGLTPMATRGDKAQQWFDAKTGITYAWEDAVQGRPPHWDICVKCPAPRPAGSSAQPYQGI